MMKQLFIKKKKDLCRAYSTKSDKQQTNNDANAAKMSSSAELKLIHRGCMCCIIKGISFLYITFTCTDPPKYMNNWKSGFKEWLSLYEILLL